MLAHTLPIAVRRRWPLPALAWGLATGAAFAALGLSLVSLSFAILIYVYSAAALPAAPVAGRRAVTEERVGGPDRGTPAGCRPGWTCRPTGSSRRR